MKLKTGDSKILVPVDFSEPSLSALRLALSAADDPSRITVIHVVQPLSALTPGAIWQTMDEQSIVENASTALDEYLDKHGATGTGRMVRIGNPPDEITKLAADAHAELVVIASEGRTGLKRVMLGSVAERVVREAKCPVLVVRAV